MVKIRLNLLELFTEDGWSFFPNTVYIVIRERKFLARFINSKNSRYSLLLRTSENDLHEMTVFVMTFASCYYVMLCYRTN